MHASRLTLFVAGAVATLVVGSGTAIAANGGSIAIGRNNHATSLTGVTNTNGSALSLQSRAGYPALKVGNTSKVVNLNADLVDGLGSGDLARTAGRTGSFDADGLSFDLDLDTFPDTIIAEAQCPPSTQLTGGGHSNYTTSGVTLEAMPGITAETFVVIVGVDETVTENVQDVSAAVTCYSPTGAITNSYRSRRTTEASAATRLPAATVKKLTARAAAQDR
jgi:hypothetical protein